MGVAFDGDGDRAIFVDGEGRIVDGDAVLLLCARHMQVAGPAKGNAVVATVMSNIGLELALRESRIELVRCPVGDKYVMEEMIKRDLSIGGEQSGHIIFSDHLFTGDGIATALSVLRVLADTGRELADLAAELVDVPAGAGERSRTREDAICATSPEIADAMDRVEQRLAGQGRLLVRYSGTEPLLRVMIEGKDQQEIQGWAPRDRRQRQRAPGMTSPDATGPRLSVNVNKVATLRNSRGGSVPSVVEARERVRGGRRHRYHRASPGRRATHHHDRRARDRQLSRAAAPDRRIQHRRGPAARSPRAGARGAAPSVHAGSREARRDHESGRLACRHADR